MRIHHLEKWIFYLKEKLEVNIVTHKLGLGLSGKLNLWRKKYKKDKSIFDYSKVYIMISRHKGQYSYNVLCYCNDSSVLRISNSKYITIYSKRKFQSQIEAESNIEKQIRFTLKKIKNIKFYLRKPIDFYENGKLINDVWANYIYNGKTWELCDEFDLN